MNPSWLLGMGAVLGLLVLEQPRSFGGHGGHGATSHAAKEGHEAPKHSNGKSAPHSEPKSPSKPQGKPQSKQPPKPQTKPKDSNSHKPLGKQGIPEHESNMGNRPDAIGSVSNTHQQATKDDKTTHHDEHHGWHHDRWWHGHHHLWSEQGFWVDAVTGLPVVAADGAVPSGGPDGVVTSPTAGPIVGRPQIQFSVDASERDAYDAAAQAAGMSRAEWIRSRLNTAVDKELK